jgi:hypothetical protein
MGRIIYEGCSTSWDEIQQPFSIITGANLRQDPAPNSDAPSETPTAADGATPARPKKGKNGRRRKK